MKAGQTAFLLFHFLNQRIGQRRAVYRFDAVEQRHGVAHFVGLQRADQVEFQVRVLRAQIRPARLRLLHPVFAEQALPGGERGR